MGADHESKLIFTLQPLFEAQFEGIYSGKIYFPVKITWPPSFSFLIFKFLLFKFGLIVEIIVNLGNV